MVSITLGTDVVTACAPFGTHEVRHSTRPIVFVGETVTVDRQFFLLMLAQLASAEARLARARHI